MICTLNPRQDYLQITLDALRSQTLPLDHWELIVVDNGSSPPVSLDLSWHPRARIVVEAKPGVLAARLRAIQEASADLLCFFDDDNAPCAGYLTSSLEISDSHPWLGAWGAAHIIGKFEVPVEPWAEPFLHMLALRAEPGNFWSNMEDWRTMPYGAGLVFRRQVGDEFTRWIAANQEANAIGRSKTNLLSHEDIAIVRMAYRLKMGSGIFECLTIDHYIPKLRLEVGYLCKLSEGFGYSGVLDKWLNGKPFRPRGKGRITRLVEMVKLARKPPQSRACWKAARRGTNAALKYIETQEAATRSSI